MHAVSSSIRSAVLGASGVVGQRFCELLSGHPFFSPPDLYSSEKSGGRKLRDVLTIPEPRISDELLECRIETIDLPSIKREKYDISSISLACGTRDGSAVRKPSTSFHMISLRAPMA